MDNSTSRESGSSSVSWLQAVSEYIYGMKMLISLFNELYSFSVQSIEQITLFDGEFVKDTSIVVDIVFISVARIVIYVVAQLWFNLSVTESKN